MTRRELLLAAFACALGAALLLAGPLFGGLCTLSFDVHDSRLDIRPWSGAATPADLAGELPRINPITPDIDLYVLPGLMRLRQLDEAGAPPFWDSRQFLGYPLLGNLPFPEWLPTAWLARGLSPVSALDWLLWLHTAVAALLAYRAARLLGAAPPAAAFAAVGFSLSAWMYTRWHLPHILYTTAWWPGLLAAAVRLRQGELRRGVAEAALFLGLMLLSGFPQVGLLLLGGFLGLVLLQRPAWCPPRLLAAAAAAALGLLIAGPQLLVSGRAFAVSLRASEQARAATSQQGLAPGALAGALLPEFFGRPSDFAGPHPPAPSMKEWLPQRRLLTTDVQDNVVENALYPGVLVLLLLPLLLRRGGDGQGRRLLLLAALALLASLIWPHAARAVPALAVFGAGNIKRLLVLLAACLPFAGALALQGLLDRRSRPPVVAGLALLLAVVLAPLAAAGIEDPQAPAFALALRSQALRQGALLVAGLVALVLATRADRRLQWLPALLLTIDLASLALAFDPFPRQSEPLPATPALQQLAARGARLAVLGTDNLLPPTAAAVHGISSVHGVAAMAPARMTELLECIESPLTDRRDPRVVHPFRLRESLSHPLLDLLAVDTIVHAEPGLAAALGWPIVFEHPAEGLGALARPGAGPRAFLCGGAEVVPDKSARLRRLADRAAPVHRTVLLEQPPELPLPPSGDVLALELAAPRADARTIAVDAPWPGIVVLAEAWDPGWKATLDGQPATLLIADHALMGVAVTAGVHQLRLEYAPRGLRGAQIAAAAALLAVLVIASSRRRA